MPRLSRKDVELVIGVLRRQPASDSEECRLLRRLELRVDTNLEALRNWKRRGHTEMLVNDRQCSSRSSRSGSPRPKS